MTATTIQCPQCQHIINLDNALTQQVQREFEGKYAADFAQKQAALSQEKEEFERRKAKENELFKERVAKEKVDMESKLRQQLSNEQAAQFTAMQQELNEKSKQVQELNASRAEIEKLKREKDEVKTLAEAQAQQQLNDILLLERAKIQKIEAEKNELRVKELEKKIDDQKKLTEEMQRKQAQGSMQLQGEVQELAIEEWLSRHFPLDHIGEIKKGANGADCLQTVNSREFQHCGKIYYESKRTKAFQPNWIEKFKNDIRDKNANIGVLVTEVMPHDMQRMGLKEGIWICTFEEFKGLCHVLRQSLINVYQAVQSQENKGDKMNLLYTFLTSNEFKLQIEGIVEGFTQMKDDLEKEKNAMKRIWAQREKQIEKVTDNTLNMYGSIKGIAGNAVQSIASLELGHEVDLPLLPNDI